MLLTRRRWLIALAPDEGTVDVMLGNEPADDFDDVGRHRHSFNEIVPGIGKCFALCWISRYGK